MLYVRGSDGKRPPLIRPSMLSLLSSCSSACLSAGGGVETAVGEFAGYCVGVFAECLIAKKGRTGASGRALVYVGIWVEMLVLSVAEFVAAVAICFGSSADDAVVGTAGFPADVVIGTAGSPAGIVVETVLGLLLGGVDSRRAGSLR